MTPSASSRKGRRAYVQSGVYTLKRAVQTLGSRALPTKRTSLGRALQEWRASLLADLGGADAVTTQQTALVDLAVRTKLMVDSVDAFILGMESLVNKKHRRLHPVVKERQSLVGQLQGLLRDLGIERRLDDAQDVAAVLASLHGPSTRSDIPPQKPPAKPTEPTSTHAEAVPEPPEALTESPETTPGE